MKYSIRNGYLKKTHRALVWRWRLRRYRWTALGVFISLVGLVAVGLQSLPFTVTPPTILKPELKTVVIAKAPDHMALVPLTKSTAGSTVKPYGIALGDTAVALSQTQLDKEFATIAGWGVGWVRIDVDWADVQPQDASHFDWSGLDRVAASAKAHHLHILGTLDFSPAWAAASNCHSSDPLCPPASDAQFASFATAAVKRYAPDGWQAWEIWNEPNLYGFWQPAPSPAAYTALLKAVYPAIKQAEPNATVITGGLGSVDGNSTSLTQQNFLSQIYASGAKLYFDAVGYHPYSFPAPPDYVVGWSGWSSMNDISNSIRSIMANNGDGAKPIWITEYGAPTNGPGQLATPDNYSGNFTGDPDHVNEAFQAQMLSQAAKQYNNDAWLGNFFWYDYQDLGTSTSTNENFFGLLRSDGSPKPAVNTLEQLTGAN